MLSVEEEEQIRKRRMRYFDADKSGWNGFEIVIFSVLCLFQFVVRVFKFIERCWSSLRGK